MGWISGERKCGIESLDGRISDAEDVWAIKDQVKNFKILYEQNPEYPCEQKDQDRRGYRDWEIKRANYLLAL